MPCYNSAAYVRDAVDSLLAQKYPHWHLIAVNDGSKDDTLSILEDYAHRDSRITVYSKKNGGYCSAVNMGLEKVFGDYFLMMGSDDRLAPDLFSELIKSVSDFVPDMIAFRAVKYVDGVPIGLDECTSFTTVAAMNQTDVVEFEREYPEHSEILFVRDTAKCYKTSLLGDLRYFGQFGFDADGIFSSLFAHKCQSFLCVPCDGYYWTLRADSLSAKTNDRINYDRLNNWIKFVEYCLSNEDYVPTQKEKFYMSMPYRLAIVVMNSKNRRDKKAIEAIRRGKEVTLAAMSRYGFDDFSIKSRIKLWLNSKAPFLWTIKKYVFQSEKHLK